MRASHIARMCWRPSILQRAGTTPTATTAPTRWTNICKISGRCMPNLDLTLGVRYDYHGGMTEKYGNMFNFDPSLYSVLGHHRRQSTLDRQQCRFHHRWQQQAEPNRGSKRFHPDRPSVGHLSTRGLCLVAQSISRQLRSSRRGGIYYDRGEYFVYLSQPAGTAMVDPLASPNPRLWPPMWRPGQHV